MRRFQFRLERVLRLRAQQERQSRRVLAAAAQRLAGLEAKVADLTQSLLACEPDQLAAGGLAGLARALHAGLATSLGTVRAEREQQAQLVEQARAAYLARRKEHEALARVRERRFTQWRAETMKAEQEQLEELARSGRAVAADVRRTP